MKATIIRSSPVVRSARVMQLEGLFAVPPSKHSELTWEVDLPIEQREWNIGLIAGPSGSGKTTVARELFGDRIINGFDWPSSGSVVDGFPKEMPIKEIIKLLNSVGFSDPPSWVRPFGVLSNGEQFRVTMARALAESSDKPFVVDEFTSVVDRTVAKIGSCAIARTVRSRNQKFIAVSCHYDIAEWLQPDWVFEPATKTFQWRELQCRPSVQLEVFRVDRKAWSIFRHHHYLDTDLNLSAACFVGCVDGQAACFCACLSFPHPIRPGWRLHRLVCLPDFQGIGLGTALSDFVSGVYRATGRPVFRTAGHPAVVHHCAKSQNWNMYRAPSRSSEPGASSKTHSLAKTFATDRMSAGFEYVGPTHKEHLEGFGLRKYAT